MTAPAAPHPNAEQKGHDNDQPATLGDGVDKEANGSPVGGDGQEGGAVGMDGELVVGGGEPR